MRLAFVTAVALLGAFGFACTDSSSLGGLTPITGIVIRSDSLVVGKGCGTETTQVFKYVATVSDSDEKLVAASTFECFADGTFTNLSPSSSGSLDFTVRIYAYERSAWEQARSGIEGGATTDQSLKASKPTWISECRATQQLDIQVLAVCSPLVPSGPASVRVETSSFTFADGQVFTCGRQYDAVSGRVAGKDVGSVACPNEFVIPNTPAPASLELDLTLTLGGMVTRETRCQTITRPGHRVTANCQ